MSDLRKNAAAVASVVWLIILITVLAVPTFADNLLTASVYSEGGYSSADHSVIAPEESDAVLPFPDLSETDKWLCSGMVSDTYSQVRDGIKYYCADIDVDSSSMQTTGTVSFSLGPNDSEIELDGYSSLRFALNVSGGTAPEKGFFTRISVSSSEGSKVAHTYIVGSDSLSELSLIGVDLSSLGGTLESVRITVYFTDTKKPDHVRISSPYLTAEDEFAESERYLTTSFKTDAGTFDWQSGNITPDNGGNALLRGQYAGNFISFGGKAYFVVSLSDVISGNLSVGVRYYDKRTGDISETTSARVSLNSSCSQYLLPVDIDGSVISYSLLFSSLTADGVNLDSVEMHEGASGIYIDNLGSVSRLYRTGDSVRFEGTVNRETAKQYSGASIGFYAVSSVYARDSVLLGSIDITTKFEFTASTDGQNFSADAYMYMAAIMTDDGSVLPLDRPRYCDADSKPAIDGIKLGFAETPAVSAFESNASHIIIDVPLDELLYTDGGSETPLTYTVYGVDDGDKNYSSRSVGLNKKLINEIESDINFCTSAGMKVYLRFVSSSPIEWMTYSGDGAENFALKLGGAEGKYLYCAIVRYLSRRNPNVEGFVIGIDAATFSNTGVDMTADIGNYIENLALTCRLTYNSSCTYLDNPIVAVPLSDDGFCSPSAVGAMLADYLNDIGAVPLALMYYGSSLEDTGAAVSIAKNAVEIGYSSEIFPMTLCKADEKRLLEDYLSEYGLAETETFAEYAAARIDEYCASAEGLRAVFVSLGNGELGMSRKVYSALKLANSGGNIVESSADHGTDEFVGQYEIWNFTDKYYVLGWRAVGVGSFSTDYSKYGGDRTERCLSAKFDKGENGAVGILLCNFERTSDLTPADAMEITVSAKSEGEDAKVNLVFIVGDDDRRAEYSVIAPADGARRTMTCDLSLYDARDAVNYVGVMVYHDEAIEIEIEKIRLTSRSAGSEELKAVFDPPADAEEDSENDMFVFIMIGIMLLLTFVIFIMTLKRERDTVDLRNGDAASRKEQGGR